MSRKTEITDFRIDFSTADIESGMFYEIPVAPRLTMGRLASDVSSHTPMVTEILLTAGRGILGCPPFPRGERSGLE